MTPFTKTPIIKIEMQCPNCRVTAKLPIKSINRVVECPACSAHIMGVAGEGVMVVRPPRDLRYLDIFCARNRTPYVVVFERLNAGERYKVVKNCKPTASPASLSSMSATEKQDFSMAEFDLSGWPCEGCGSRHLMHSSGCCRVLFCGGQFVRKENGGIGWCPKCGREDLYTIPLLTVPGNDNKPKYHLAPAPMETGLVLHRDDRPRVVHDNYGPKRPLKGK